MIRSPAFPLQCKHNPIILVNSPRIRWLMSVCCLPLCSQLVKRRFNVSLLLLFTPKQTHETKWQREELEGVVAGAFHLSQRGNYLLLFLLCGCVNV